MNSTIAVDAKQIAEELEVKRLGATMRRARRRFVSAQPVRIAEAERVQ